MAGRRSQNHDSSKPSHKMTKIVVPVGANSALLAHMLVGMGTQGSGLRIPSTTPQVRRVPPRGADHTDSIFGPPSCSRSLHDLP